MGPGRALSGQTRCPQGPRGAGAPGDKRFRVDCHWPDTGQVVELDGWEGHRTRAAFREDRARDRALRVAGYSVTRLTWAQLKDEPSQIATDLRTLLANR